MGTGFSKQKKQAKLMQEQLSKMQSEMKDVEVTGTAGNGLVTVIMNGEGDLKQLKIKPECVDVEDIEGLEDLIKAAHQDAQKKIKDNQLKGMPSLPQGMPNLGGLNL